ncbi:response regulator transcription factor [Alkalicoccobacillus murimartini]|uniref:DNA-binding response OmpR family regulator n=1 Tax=Alkalicoccobacillus murimartini TaxID=171685 RepID=A0ABT9YJ36_9BACI|nr:response regulator transcription factor [Alkalicoccobacillus murimartini]MDQ0207495.1 DNA-binding response OmpR family regulator [Alkalicoccobacillus murimartini]
MERLLLVEDDVAISDMVRTYLTKEGFKVDPVFTGKEAIQRFENDSYDLVLLDLMLPEMSGMDFLQVIRQNSFVPVIIMSAKDGEADKAVGLGFGADDYITKPFSMIELLARVKAVIRRSTQYKATTHQEVPVLITIHDLQMDVDNFIVKKSGHEISLTSKEWKILKLFFENPKKVMTKEQIYHSVWDDHYYGDDHVINVHMSRLREKIEDDPAKPLYIKTVWGIGYKLGEFK